MRQLVYTSLLLIITLRSTCGERNICSTISKYYEYDEYLKISQNISKYYGYDCRYAFCLLEIIILFFLFHLSLNLVFDISFLGNQFCLADLFLIMIELLGYLQKAMSLYGCRLTLMHLFFVSEKPGADPTFPVRSFETTQKRQVFCSSKNFLNFRCSMLYHSVSYS